MNLKRMEVTLEELSENFDRHVATTSQSRYFVMTGEGGESKLKIRLYSQGGEAEVETLAFATGGAQPTFDVSVDGEYIGARVGEITIDKVFLARGWRLLELGGKNISSARVRINGSISEASVLEN